MATHVIDADQLERELAELLEVEKFPPPKSFREKALVKDDSLYEEAERDFQAFWAKQATELVDWFTEPQQALNDSNPPFYKWFEDGKLNVSYNCLDRHVEAGNGDKVAFHWRGEEGEEREITYAELLGEVQKFANALKDRGIGKGDIVGIYLPMIPEVAVAMLACARIGAPHNVVFGGFSPDAVKERMEFANAKALVTVDGARRKGKTAPIKSAVDEKIGDVSSIETIFVVKATDADCDMQEGRDVWYHEALQAADPDCEPEQLDAEHPLYVLYTSGSTAKPKGVLHTTGGYLLGVTFTHKYVFDLKPDEDVYWCAADVGWVTGHSYIVYGPLSNGATSVMYEGAPDYPDKDVWWGIVERYGVTIMYTAPTAIRACIKWGTRVPGGPRPLVAAPARQRRRADQPEGVALVPQGDRRRALPDRRHLVADRDRAHPDQPAPRRDRDQAGLGDEAAAGHRRRGGRRRGQRDRRPEQAGPTDPAPAVAGHAPHALPGGRPVRRDLLRQVRQDDLLRGRRRPQGRGRLPLAPRPRGRRHQRLRPPPVDGGDRVGRRLLQEGRGVRGDRPDGRDTGQAICAFVTLEGDIDGTDEIAAEIREHVAKRISKIARPSRIIWTGDLPKTRSGKIMRRLLRDIAEGRELGDVTTLRDPAIMEQLEEKVKERQASDAGE